MSRKAESFRKTVVNNIVSADVIVLHHLNEPGVYAGVTKKLTTKINLYIQCVINGL